MKKWILVTLIVGGVLLTTGAIVAGNEIRRSGGNFVQFFSQLDRHEYQTNTYEYTEDFNSFSFEEAITNINLHHSEDSTTRIVVKEIIGKEHTITSSNGILTVLTDFDWYEWLDWFKYGPITTDMTMDVYLPVKEYQDLEIKGATTDITFIDSFIFENIDVSSSTGGIELKDMVADEAYISTSTGNISVETSTLTKLTINSSTGNINLLEVVGDNVEIFSSTGNIVTDNSVYVNKADFSTATGDINLVSFDAEDIDVESSTGNITASLLSDKTFSCSSSTGSVNVPNSVNNGETFTASTSTGYILVTIVE